MSPLPSYLYAVTFAAAAAVSFAILPLVRKWCVRAGLIDDPGQRKIHSTPVPLAGGITVLIALVVPLCAAWLWLHFASGSGGQLQADPAVKQGAFLSPTETFLLSYGFGKRSGELFAIVFGAIGMLAVGCLDDKYELRPLPKFGGQLLMAMIVAAAGVRITLFVPNVIFSYAVTILWILTVVNAFNFMDNMNGLCAGLGFIASCFFAFFAAFSGQYLVGLLGFVTAGAVLGFLPYNYPKGHAFLGDGGSHLIGYLLAIMAVLPHFHTPAHPHRWAVLTPLFVLAVPLLDLAWVVVLRTSIGQPFYQGDTNHLSHRLVRAGLGRAQAVALIWLVAALCGLIPVLRLLAR